MGGGLWVLLETVVPPVFGKESEGYCICSGYAVRRVVLPCLFFFEMFHSLN